MASGAALTCSELVWGDPPGRDKALANWRKGDGKSIKPVQKQFLLIGPANREKVLRWLRQIASNLDLKVR